MTAPKDPFADRPQIHFDASPPSHSASRTDFTQRPGGPIPRPFGEQVGGQECEDDEYLEKQPLYGEQNFSGGFYPPP